MPPFRSALRCESLEARENPSGVTDTFDAARAFVAPAGWSQWASNGQEYYGVSRTAQAGPQGLAVYGTVGVESRLWNDAEQAGDVVASAAVRADTPAPVVVFGRGTKLNTTTEGLVGVSVERGGVVTLRESVNGADRAIATTRPTALAAGPVWLKVTLTLNGTTATVRVQRADNGQFLTSAGAWQVAEANALSASVTHRPAVGFVGFARLSGPYGTAYVDEFAATPTDPPKPDIARNYDHIRLAQLAYAGTPVGATERQLARDSIDLIVPNPQYLNTFAAAAPDGERLIYSNSSNVYQELLTDWLAYADRTGTPREAAFYHVTQASPYTGGSASAQPVSWFWGVARVSARGAVTDLTANARGGRSVGVAFGGAGEAVAVGFTDPFREINVTLNRGAQAGWSGVWEYAAAVAADGTPTDWKRLTLASDGTNGMTASGRITFDPPANWRAAKVGGSAGLFYVRLRATAGAAAQAPDAKSLFGRDFTGGGTAANSRAGTIPAFDSQADANRDGYLTDAEYARRRAGFDARFVYESRAFYTNYGAMRYAVNPSSQPVRAWAGEYHLKLLAANPQATGVFMDNATGKVPLGGMSVSEPTANYTADATALTDAIRRAVSPKWILANTSGQQGTADGITAAAGGAFEEFLLRPTDVNWSGLGDVANVVNRRLAAAGPGEPRPYVVIDSRPGPTGITDPRTQLGVLSYYYLLADPDDTFLMFFGGSNPTAPWSQKWTPAAAANVGRPTAAMTTFATGSDPQNAALTYKVFARDYQNALVLFKPRSYTLGRGTGTTADATATTHQLNGNYRAVNADGSLGPVVRSVTLRNGEGAVLMKA